MAQLRSVNVLWGIALMLAGVFGCEGIEIAKGYQAEQPTRTARPDEFSIDGLRVIASGVNKQPEPQPRSSRREPRLPDPMHGDFSLSDATKGVEGEGILIAEIITDLGTLRCDLFADDAPYAVAHFVGLARGARPYWDDNAHSWVRRPLYRMAEVARVVPGGFLQIEPNTRPYSVHVSVPVDGSAGGQLERSGQLAFVRRGGVHLGPDLVVTDGPSPSYRPEHEDDRLIVFGQCRPADVVYRLVRVPQMEGNRPRTPLHVRRVLVRRVRATAQSTEE
ncbi:MAG: peptidylprolyl isomerase [Myxococcota bacterium]